MTFNFDLGAETFSSASSDLDLALHASVVISTPPGTWNPWSTVSFKEELTAGNIRVDNDASIQIHLYISFDAESQSRISQPEFVSRIGEIICRSKFWSELSLEPSSTGCIDNLHEQYPGIPHLSLSLRKSNRRATALKASRIPAALQTPCDAPTVDVCPTVFLSTINVRLEYTCSSLRSCQLLPYFPIVQLESPRLPKSQLQSIQADWEAFHCLIPQTDLHQGPNHPSSSQELKALLNAALATLIAGETAQKCHPKDRQHEKPALLPLPHIAPSIFSPGYRESLNQRAQFIPSIAKSLTSIIKHSRDPNLQNKAIRFQPPGEPESEIEPGVSSNTRAHTATMSLKSRLKTSLWRVAANQIHTAQSTRRRSPVVLVPAVSAESDDEQSFEDELQFDVLPLEEALCSQETGMSEDRGFSDRYLGTDEEGSVSGETDVSPFPTKDDGCSNHWEDLFSYGHSETDHKTMSTEGCCQHNQEMLSDFLEYSESPLLLSDESALFESETFEEGWDKMLCD